MRNTDDSTAVAAVRGFNRFYTRQIGLLDEGLLKSEFSLTEMRVLYEIAHRNSATASDLCNELGLDAGYLSRIFRGFRKRGFIKSTPSDLDRRQSLITLTGTGKKVFAPLDKQSSNEVSTMLSKLSPQKKHNLIDAMNTIEECLGEKSVAKLPFIIRSHRPGDMGWVVHRHGVLYSQEYGWDEHFEALVAGIVSDFIKNFDPKRDRCWIAEREGEIVGSIFLVKKSKTVARLRLLLVEPNARGLGIGKSLVDECVRTAKQFGYKKIVLWTQSNLSAARHIYEQAGFKLVHEEPNNDFGNGLVAETWELTLKSS